MFSRGELEYIWKCTSELDSGLEQFSMIINANFFQKFR